MLWIRVETNLARDPRTYGLRRALELNSRAETAGLIMGLWAYTQEFHPDGDLVTLDWEVALEHAGIDLKRQPAELEAILKTAGFIEEFRGKAQWVSWSDISGNLHQRREADRLRKRDSKEIRGNSAGIPADGGRKGAGIPAAHDTTDSTEPTTSAPRAKRAGTSLQILGDSIGEVAVQAINAQASKQQRLDHGAEFVFWYWAVSHKKRAADTIFDTKRRSRLISRLKEGEYHATLNLMLYAVDGSLLDDNLMGRNSEGKKWNGIETIFRDRGQVEKLAELVPAYRKEQPHKLLERARKRAEGAE